MYIKEFEIRWNDVDANRHLANQAYIAYAAHTRMSFLIENGFDQHLLQKHDIGPVVFYEHIYYFREVFPGKPVKVSLELSGLSEDGMFFEFRHNFYDYKGRNFASCEMMGGWIDLKTRKLIGLEQELQTMFEGVRKPEDFKVLTKEDTRRFKKKPMDLS
ncbi:thioesterase family protein [Zhouia spongiae]|uniref:Thioesterase family protein n=1 Tax=Zhouia spongiae TaxID=2202721 RepID=A0ABY3YNS4_9FLAO|nr:thioesterase family protein [Zhouia spongiae]UNY99470.1 thioesterase family protein [Zhouia spongiae]